MTRFGIVGSGYMGRTYAACLTGLTRQASLVAITGGTRAPALAAEFGVAVEPGLDRLLAREDVDAVIVATPHSTHVPITRRAAAAGVHVYVEKPMARDVTECDEMAEACRAAGVQLGVNKVLRYRRAPRAAQRLIVEGAIGDVRYISARDVYPEFIIADKTWALDPSEGGPFLDWGVHCADLLRWFTGSEAVLASAQFASFTPAPPAWQTAIVQFRFASGALASVWMSYEVPRPALRPADAYLIVGSKGLIDLDAYGAVRLGRGDGWELVDEQPAFDFLGDYLDPARLEGFAEQVDEFAAAVRDGRPPAVGAREGRAAVEMVQAAARSARTDRTVALPLA